MRATSRRAGLLVGLLVAATLAAVPLTGASAEVESNIHWGQSPYYPTCIEGPCRVVLIADKTADAAMEAQVRRWVDWMNYVRVTYNLSFPAFAWFGPQNGLEADPGCATAPGFISLCRSNAIVDADCGTTDPNVLRCATFSYGLSDNHINWSRSSIRSTELAPADTWTVVCGALGRAIGMPQSADTNSCMSSNLTLGTGQEKYFVTADWLALISIYDHPAGS